MKMTLAEIMERFEDMEGSFVIDNLIIDERDEEKQYIYNVYPNDNGTYTIADELNQVDFGEVEEKSLTMEKYIKVAEKYLHDGASKDDLLESFAINPKTYEIISDRIESLHYGDYAKTLNEAFAILKEYTGESSTFKWVRTYEDVCKMIEEMQDKGEY